jgi:DNA topoisomerase-2
MDTACALQNAKESKLSAKKTDGTKTRNVKVDGLTDANWAGTANSHRCTLILTEGLSAETGVRNALTDEMRYMYGLYALKGKPLNVRGETLKKITANEEITGIKKILGLVAGTNYTREEVNKKLRYGKVLILTDADLDGHHIKGLILNMFHVEFPSLTNVKDFLGFMVTPIIKAIPENDNKLTEVLFYSNGEYSNWLERTDQRQQNKYRIKYYKGLGTSTTSEFVEYMENDKLVFFNKSEETNDDNILDMVFNKKRAEERKKWIQQSNPSYLETSGITEVNYSDFINKELVHFSIYDCERSIPSLIDGLKTSQRKILYCAFLKNLDKEIKVAQFAGYVSEKSNYHHGEASLMGAIVGMAQSFVGSNNVILLSPNGQFGSRLHGGEDAASPRYIFTKLETITRFIFPKEDDAILNYLIDDGDKIEPQYYIPIIPMVLVNGSVGIGTGFSTFIPCYDIKQIIQCTKNIILEEETSTELIPYYNRFKGTIVKKSSNKYDVFGVCNVNKNILEISELPLGCWTDKYIKWLKDLYESETPILGSKIKDYTDLSTEHNIKISVTFNSDISNMSNEEILNAMKLTKSLSTSNMHLFNSENKLTKYDSPKDIIKAYIPTRMLAYSDRKIYKLEKLRKELINASNKVRYIEANISGEIELKHKTKNQIIDMLKHFNYDLVDESYDYLLNMTMISVSNERVAKLKEEENEINILIYELESKSIIDLWIDDLNNLNEFLESYNVVEQPTTNKKSNKLTVKKSKK